MVPDRGCRRYLAFTARLAVVVLACGSSPAGPTPGTPSLVHSSSHFHPHRPRDVNRVGVFLTALLLALVVSARCGGGGSTPRAPTTPTPTPAPPPSGTVVGTTIDALSGTPLAGVTVRVDGYPDATSDTAGEFRLDVAGAEQLRATTIASATTVERRTHMRVPGPRATLSLLPSAFDLAAFNEMYRSGGVLHRWTSAPRLVVQKRVLRFTTTGDQEFVASAEVMTDAEANDIVADLTWALPQFTGTTLSGFAGHEFETPAEGDRVRVVNRDGVIVVARYDGLTSGTTYWGYTRWWWNGAGEMLSASMMLDDGFDSSGSIYRRSLRSHELGHAMSCTHVTVRTSVMNANARTEPNVFDRDGGRFAFLRPPLNRTPDTDPDPYSTNLRSLAQQIFSRGMH